MKLGKKPGRKDKKASKRAKRRAKPKAGVTSIESSFLVLFISITSLLFIGALLVFQQLHSNLAETRLENQRSLISSYAQQIEQTMGHYTQVMDIAAKDPALGRALQNGDQEAIKNQESQLAGLFPSALHIKILPTDHDEPDNSLNPPISFACLDLLNRSHSGSNSIMEVHLMGKPQQHIDIARSIKDNGGKTIGTLLLTLPVQMLKHAVLKMSPAGGLVELLQNSKRGASITIARRGNLSLKSDKIAVSSPIRNTIWKIAYWPGESSGSLGGSITMLFWGIVAGIWVSFSIFLFIVYRRIYKALLNDMVMIIKLVKDIQHGDMSASYPIALKNCLGAMEQLRMVAGEMTGLRNKKTTHNGSQPVLQGSPGENDDIVGLGFTNNTDALEVREINEAELEQNSGGNRAPAEIFKAYDIRGIVNKTLTPDVVQDIGRALGSEAQERGQQKVVVARDGRLSGPELIQSFIRGLQQSGREVIDIGMVPTPVLYFASNYLGNGSGAMLTGSHNPPEYNGIKMMLRGDSLHGDSIKGLKTRIDTNNLISGEGSVQTIDVVPSYIERITSDVRLEKPLKIVVDCGNGVAGMIAPQLYQALGCEVIEMFCDVDGNFPNHHPDPSKPENMIPLTRAVTEQGADLGLAFDGDGDRLGVIDSSGKIIWPDRYLMLMAMDVLTRQPGAQIIFDVKCSTHLEKVISENGGQPLMWKTGHSFIKAKMKETGAQLAGEMSGHIFFKERWMGFDDALYAGARLLEILSSESKSSSEVFASLPESISTPELNVHLNEGENFLVIEKLKADANFPGARMIDIDGLRLEFEDGWGLVRASNTTPSLVLRFEADDAAALGRIQDIIRTQLLAIHPDMDLPF